MLVLLIAVPALGVLGQVPPGASVSYDTTTVIWITETVISYVSVHNTVTQIITHGAVTSEFADAPVTSSSTSIPTSQGLTHISASSTATEVVTETKIVTVSASPSTSSLPPPTSTSPNTSRRVWLVPPQITDLSAFNISAFAGGHDNLNIVKGIPAYASATSIAAASASNTQPVNWDNSSSVLQLLYPAHSVNPAQKPQGGAQFYASPLDVAEAKNITLQYSVFFPVDFDWVLAGKLPGLYGGRAGCSGGDSASDCFSTRLMWRRGGSGELYLYAPKDKQTKALCSHPQSVCDTTYGFSIGRGSFKWAKGAWTTVQQSVALNTPGKRDGGFTLDVNGRRVIERHDVYYRGVPLPGPGPDPTGKTHHKPKPTGSRKPDGGLLGLGPLLGKLGLLGRGKVVFQSDPAPSSLPAATIPVYQAQHEWAIEVDASGQVLSAAAGVPDGAPTGTASTNATGSSSVNPMVTQIPQPTGETAGKPVGFIGLFFSTFFGGHGPQYATPRDQYVWFKDFAISHNG